MTMNELILCVFIETELNASLEHSLCQ